MSATRRLRLAFCIDSFNVGGTELNAVRLAEALDPQRFELAVCHLQHDGPLRARYEAVGATLKHIPISGLLTFSTFRAGLTLASWLRRWRADIVHAHDIYSNIFSVPYARLGTGAAVIASRRWWYDSPRPGLIPLNRFSYMFAHRIFANSRGVAELLSREEHVRKRKIQEIPNFLTDSAFELAGDAKKRNMKLAWGLPDDVIVVGSVARLAPVKDHAAMLHAIATLDDTVHLVLIGDGPSRSALEILAAELGVAHRVRFLGTIVSTVNLHQFFDVTVLSSRSEGFPNSIIEALAVGCPVVATDVGGVPDIVMNNRTGMLVPPNDPAALALAINRLIRDPELRRRLGSQGREQVFRRYHSDVVIANLMTVYESLVRARTGAVPSS